MSRLLALIDLFVPRPLQTADPLHREQARLSIGIALSISLWGPFFAVTFLVMGSFGLAAVSALGTVFWLAVLYSFHRTGSYALFGNVVAFALFGELIAIAGITGGFDANAVIWMMLVPVVATGIAGMRSGIVWGLLVLLAMGAYFVALLADVVFPTWITEAELPWVRFFSLVTLSASITAILVLYEMFKFRAVEITRESREEVSEASASLASVLDNATDGIITVDEEGTILSVNPAAEEMFGYGSAELIGKNAAVLMSSQQQETEWLAGVRCEMTGQRKDGSVVLMDISLSDLPARGRRRYVGIIRDITERRHAEDELQREQALLKQLLNAHEMERQLLAYEIHDGLVQHMTGALMHLESREDEDVDPQFERGVSLVRESIREGRRLISGLRPPILDELGLVPAIEYLIREFEGRDCPAVELTAEVKFDRLEPLLESSLFRICQEGLTNAHRHSEAEQVQVSLTQSNGVVNLRVQDDGIGFDAGVVTEQSFGLAGIRERAKLLGGTAEIESQPGQGTRIHVEVPLRTASESKGSA